VNTFYCSDKVRVVCSVRKVGINLWCCTSFYPLSLHMKNDILGLANIKRHFVSNEPVREFSEFVLDTCDE